MMAGRSRTGQPVVVLAGIMLLWVTARIALWQSPFPLNLPNLPEVALAAPPLAIATPVRNAVAAVPQVTAGALQPGAAGMRTGALAPAYPVMFEPASLASRGAPIDENSAHQLMWLAAFGPSGPEIGAARRSWPAATARAAQAAPFIAQVSPQASATDDRWSLSAWAFLRQGGSGVHVAGAPVPQSYGASQAGGVLRYRLAPTSAHAPAAYMRATSALNRSDDRELALGLSLRPLARVPVAVMGEGRLRVVGGDMQMRPAIMAVSEFPPLALPRGLRAETYLQAGQVLGPDATAFADGQLRITAGAGELKAAKLRAGGGIWGGIQEGAARLDAGPSAQLDLAVGSGTARLGVDYRVRLAGDAVPNSGVAVTLSTGF